MTQKAINRSLITSGLVVLLLGLAAAVVLPLHAAPPPQPADRQAASQENQEATIEATSTVTATSAPPLRPTNRPTPEAADTPAVTPTSTTAPVPTPTSQSPRAPSPLTTPTGPPSLLLTPTELPTPTPTPSPTRAPTNTPAPTITTTPLPTPTTAPTPLPLEKAITYTRNNPMLVGAICLIPLLTLGLLLVLAALWKARPRSAPGPPPPSPTPTGPYVESVGIPGSPRRLHLKPDGVTIGQAPGNDLVISEDFPQWDTVSRRHARIYAKADRWIVEDLGSRNGVYVNGRRTGKNLLRDGWRLGIGGVEFVFHANTGEERQ